jgi:DNA replication licensing factor MCM4
VVAPTDTLRVGDAFPTTFSDSPSIASQQPQSSSYTDSTMSSPTKRRSQRTAASATPRRSARGANPTSSPPPLGPDEQLQSEASQASQRGLQATPRNSRLQSTSTQSPLFFRSSPAIPSGSGAGNDAPESDDGGATPRASGMTIGGML